MFFREIPNANKVTSNEESVEVSLTENGSKKMKKNKRKKSHKSSIDTKKKKHKKNKKHSKDRTETLLLKSDVNTKRKKSSKILKSNSLTEVISSDSDESVTDVKISPEVAIVKEDLNLDELMKKKKLLQARLGAYLSDGSDGKSSAECTKAKKDNENSFKSIILLDSSDESENKVKNKTINLKRKPVISVENDKSKKRQLESESDDLKLIDKILDSSKTRKETEDLHNIVNKDKKLPIKEDLKKIENSKLIKEKRDRELKKIKDGEIDRKNREREKERERLLEREKLKEREKLREKERRRERECEKKDYDRDKYRERERLRMDDRNYKDYGSFNDRRNHNRSIEDSRHRSYRNRDFDRSDRWTSRRSSRCKNRTHSNSNKKIDKYKVKFFC